MAEMKSESKEIKNQDLHPIFSILRGPTLGQDDIKRPKNKCQHESCNKCASFNYEGDKKPLYCATHKKDEMVLVSGYKCQQRGCKRNACYRRPGENRPLFCGDHKQDGMTLRSAYSCKDPGCSTQAVFSFPSESKPSYCNSHKKEGMINIRKKYNRFCQEQGCSKTAAFNLEGEEHGKYCSEHKKDGMINLHQDYCQEENCSTLASFAAEGDKKALFCAKHKKENMVNVTTTLCRFPGCKKYPSYNILGKGPVYCLEHKSEDMVNVVNKLCEEEGCGKQASYNSIEEKQAKYCATHKRTGMVNVREKGKRCKTPMCFTMHCGKYEGYCLYCFTNLFPDKPTARNYKTKERAVVEFVLKEFPGLTWSTDKKIQDGCSKRRPDLLLDCGDQVLIIEIDENQHAAYECSCENKRLMELSQDVHHRPIVYLRFNPDDYVAQGKKVPSCWKIDGNGMCCVKKGSAWEDRLKCLKEQITYWLSERTAKTVEVIQLFYDN